MAQKLICLALFILVSISIKCIAMRKKINMAIVPEAVGANNIFSLEDGSYVFELRDWLREEYGTLADEAPGLVKMVDGNKNMIKVKSGWFLGGKTLDKIAVLEEQSIEYSYQVTLLFPDLPEKNIIIQQANTGFWTVYGIARSNNDPFAVIVFHRPLKNPFFTQKREEEVLLVTFDIESERIVATTKLEFTLVNGFNAGNSLNFNFEKNYILLIGHAKSSSAASLEMMALNVVDLKQIWKKEVILPVNSDAKDKSNLPDQNSSISPDFFRTAYGIKTCTLGDNSGWIAIFGMKTENIAVNMEGLFEIDMSGNIVFHQGNNQSVTQIDYDNKNNGVIILQENLYRVAGAKKRVFNGILNWQKRNVLDVIVPKEEKFFVGKDEIVPLSITKKRDTILIAPIHYLNNQTNKPTEDEAFGANSTEIKGMVTIPLSWHRIQSENVKKRMEWIESL